MFLKKRKSLITLLIALFAAVVLALGALTLTQRQTAYAYNSSNIPKGNNVIAIHDGTKFDAVELKTLATTAGYTDLNAMMSAATESGTAIAETLKGKVVQLGVDRKVGGSALKWAPVYLSRSTDGDAILTLWLATDIYRSSWSDGTYSLSESKNFNGSTIYSDTYDGSFIRHKLNGKSGWTADWGEKNNEANPNAYIGTMVSDFYGSGAFASYVTTPAKVSWQKNTHKMKNDPNWDGFGSLVKGAKANYPCDWLNDNVWLPSMYEVYDSSIPDDYNSTSFTADGGLWGVSKTGDIVSSTDGAWLRSGYPNHCANPYNLVSYVDYVSHSYGNVFRNFGVRPALHLNLSKVADMLPKAEVTVGNTTTPYSTIEQAWQAANTQPFATVKMLADATVGETLTVDKGKNITLDLNGYKLEYAGDSESVIQVNGMFTLEDSNPEKANTVTYYTSDTKTATASIKGGVITGGRNSGVVVGRSHEETANDVTSIIAEFVGVFTMNRGNISGNITASGGSGGGVFVSHGSTANLYGGTISYNYARVHGGGVRLEGATLNIGTKNKESTCEISHNIAYKSSGAIDERAVYESTIYMNGGKISYNTALTEVFGGLCVEQSTTLTIDKGEISYNSAPSIAANQGNGGGIGVISTKNATIKNAVIKGNNAGKYGGGLYVGSDSTVQLENCTIGGTDNGDKNTANLGGGVYVKGSLTMNGGTIAGNTADFGGGVRVDTDATFIMNGDATISHNKATKDGGGICVCGATKVELKGTISDNAAVAGGGIYYEHAGNHTIDGATIKNNVVTTDSSVGYSGFGGGIYVDHSTVTMSGGTISGNSVTKGGGGVYVLSNSTFEMTNGAISGNMAGSDNYGGGVYVSGTFIMSDGAISGNEAQDGGGVYMNGGTFTMNGGTIKGNNATFYNGGGVEVLDGTFNVSGGAVIKDNVKGGNIDESTGLYTGGTKNNVYLESVKITVTGALTTGAIIGVYNSGEIATGYAQSEKPSVFFKADDSEKCASANNGTVSIGAHTGGTATCVSAKVCTHCGASYGEVDSSNHTPSADDGDCTTAITCSGCGTVTTAAQTSHYFSGNYVTSSTQHWHVCTHSGCTKTDTKKNHNCNLINPTPTYLAAGPTCTQGDSYYYSCVCGAAGTETFRVVGGLGHDFVGSTVYVSDGTQHWKKCSRCDEEDKDNAEDCSGGTATCTEKAKCSVCHAEYGEVLGHDWDEGEITTPATCKTKGEKTFNCKRSDCTETKTEEIEIDNTAHSYASDWTKDESGHWHAATCGHSVKQDYAEHSGGTASCTEKAKCSVCQAEYGDLAAHDFENGEYIKGVTEHWKKCKNCTAQDTDHKESHSGGTATCMVVALCEKCGFNYGGLGSHSLTHNGAHNATCTENGNTEYWWCVHCEKYFSDSAGNNEIAADSTVINKSGHSFGDWQNEIAATCTTEGTKAHKDCLLCHKHFDSNNAEIADLTIAVNFNAHSYDTAKWMTDETGHWHAATCGHSVKQDYAEHSGGTASCTEKAKCSVCQAEYGNFVSHDFANSTTYKSDGTQHWKQCANCTAEDTDNKVNHNGTATCTEKAKCSVCQAEYGEVLGHDWDEGEITTPATCKTKGEKTFNCKRSDCTETKTEEIEIDDTAHSYASDWTKDESGHWHAATCGHSVKQDYAEHSGGTASCTEKAKCSVCQAEYGNFVSHDFANSTTYKSDGTQHWKQCANCTAEDTDNKVNHNGTATCTEKAKCSVCQAEYGEVLGHDWDEGEITTPATCKTKGEKTFNCKRSDCTETKTEEIEIDDTAHSYASDWTKDETGHWHAATCGHDTEKSGFAAHTAGDWITDTEPQVGVAGGKHKECTVCGYTTETAEIPAIVPEHQHTFSTDWTKDETGHWHAATCGHDTEKSGFATHTAGDWITDTEPQVGVAGSRHKECTVCGYTMQTEVIEPLIDTLVEPGSNGEENKVVVTMPEGFTPDIELVVTEIEKENYGSYEAIADTVNGEINLVYDVTLKSDGVTIQPDGTLTIKLRIPENLVGKNFKLFHLHGSEATDMEYAVDGNYAVVNTDKLSEFIFVGEKTAVAPTPDGFNPLWLILIIIVSLVIVGEVGYIVYRKVRKNKAGEVQE